MAGPEGSANGAVQLGTTMAIEIETVRASVDINCRARLQSDLEDGEKPVSLMVSWDSFSPRKKTSFSKV